MMADVKDNVQILIVGAGGLGCELLKDIVLLGFRHITCIDLDTISLTNLNRQFLFRHKDIGKYKAEVAAQFMMDRYPGVKIEALHNPIQKYDRAFYKRFHIIIAGLDNIEARRWLNSMVHSMVEFDDKKTPLPETQIPLIDGGSEEFRGQARVIIPFTTDCYECTLDTLSKVDTYPMCTLAENPRLPEHCIEYAFISLWEKEFKDKKVVIALDRTKTRLKI